MNLTNAHLNLFIHLTKAAANDYSGDSECGPGNLKNEYKKLGRRILKYIAEKMALTPDQYDIRWNPGGIACSGDSTLHTDKVYVALHDNCGSGWFYWRTVKGRKDYSGGANQIIRWDNFRTVADVDKLVARLREAQDLPSTGSLVGDINRAMRVAAGV